MSKGRVKYFNEQKGWGIISGADLQQDVYVHYTAINMEGYRTLSEGQQVSYDLLQSDNGPAARNVTPER